MGIEDDLKTQWELWATANEWGRHHLSTVRFDATESEPEFLVIHNSIRDHWEKVKKSKAEKMEPGSCDLDDWDMTRKHYLPYMDLHVRVNYRPSLEHHIFLKTLEHRDYPVLKDHLSVMQFVSETEWAVFLNLRGSGAGIPDHLHYQGQKREHFPLLNMQRSERTLYATGNYKVSTLEHVNFGIVVDYQPEKLQEAAEYLIELGKYTNEQGFAYNLMFDRNSAILFPRCRETATKLPPELADCGMGDWQIAGQEMGYLFTAKNKAIFENLTREALTSALADVTLQAERQDFTKGLLEVVRGC